MPKFLHVTLTNAKGKTVAVRDTSFCPSDYDTRRTRPDAPDTSPYPQGCPTNPFTLGAVWGVQAGWSANTFNYFSDFGQSTVTLPNGKYTAKVSVGKQYQRLFGLTSKTQTVHVTVRKAQFDGAAPAASARAAKSAIARPNAARPTGKPSVPKGPKPDLRPIPAFGMQVIHGDTKATKKRNYLEFSANVWNAGPSPLVVDGFRRGQKGLMDAYEYFYNSKGKQVGYAPTGTMEWDPRVGHQHWHFTDFASYRLLGSNKKEIVRSQKQAFCLGNTDGIDYTVKNANWKPDNTDLHTACGSEGSLSVREELSVGSGDTYDQYLPGQSFDITSLKDGTYYVEVIANPDHRLYEASTKNNVSLRKVILGTKNGKRTVTVPPYQLINAQ